ncbi:hypothetical protein QU481_09240 [Crenobacter sp. SG2303]|uniref:SUN domain-containing protein n=1 Tax=Crenobacter oryzisoli TaxID=3056844 RepID=A0ABT7XMR0_9NEIS|nr:hypothetical protein [Crenobacter sp. SG2303]MDN0075077.1 hypothetical protein [Crenobacter sp. SG2303]
MTEEPKNKGFWQTLPGILTAVAGVVTAVTGLLVALQQAGLFERRTQPIGATSHAASIPSPEFAKPSAVPAAGRINLLSPENGGSVVSATSDDWRQVILGRQKMVVLGGHQPEEAVFAFQGQHAATFDTIAVLVPQADMSNLKDFELSAALDSPVGPFTRVGTYSVRNVKVFDQPYQMFTFPPVTARYVRLRLLLNHNGYDNPFEVYDFQLFGSLVPKS